MNCPKEIITDFIFGTEEFLDSLKTLSVNIYSGATKTVDVVDLTGVVIVDSSATAVLKRENVIKNKTSEEPATLVSPQRENQIMRLLKIVVLEVMV